MLPHLFHRDGQTGDIAATCIHIILFCLAEEIIEALAGLEYLLDQLISYILSREDKTADRSDVLAGWRIGLQVMPESMRPQVKVR